MRSKLVPRFTLLLVVACCADRSAGELDEALSVAAPPPATAPGTVQLSTSLPCDDATCHALTVTCAGVPTREVLIREIRPEAPRGTVVLTTGGSGHARYDRAGRESISSRLVAADFQVFQLEWMGEEGWLTGSQGRGFKDLMCGYAELVRWIVAERATHGDTVCAQGNSGGSLQNAYGLAVYGLEEILDMVILSGGPPIVRLEEFCFPDNADLLKQRMAMRDPREARNPRQRQRAARGRLDDRILADGADVGDMKIASVGRSLTDRVMGWMGAGDYCQLMERPPDPEALAFADEVSLLSRREKRDLEYPHTKVNFVGADSDHHFQRQGREFYEVVTAPKSWYEIPDAFHNVDQSPAGADKITELFLNECRPW